MQSDKYLRECLKTEAIDFEAIHERLRNTRILRLLHASMGLCTEAGEFADQLKKYIFYRKDLDEINLIEELGDILWYMAISLDALRKSFSECMAANNRKLRQRYEKQKFAEAAANRRDLPAEIRALLDND